VLFRSLTVAGSPLAVPRRHRAGPGEQVGSIRGRGDGGVHGVPVSGQQVPGHGHGLAGVRPGLALAADARHRGDHDHGDDGDQNEEEHGPLLPAAPAGTWPLSTGGIPASQQVQSVMVGTLGQT